MKTCGQERRKILQAMEFMPLFILLPGLVAALNHGLPVLVFLWILTALCLPALLKDPHFDRRQLWKTDIPAPST